MLALLAPFVGRWALLAAGAAALALVVGSARLDASRARAELAATQQIADRLASDLVAQTKRADTAERQLVEATAAAGRLKKRVEATEDALREAAALERRLRRGKAPPRRPQQSRSDRARDAVEWLRSRDASAASGTADGGGGADGP